MQTIVFDVDDTLYDQAQSFHQTVREQISQDFTPEELDNLYKKSRKYSELLFDESERGGEITTFEWQTGRFIKAFENFGISMNQEQAADFHYSYKDAQANITLFPEIVELLELLKNQGKQLAILTNGEEGHQSMKIEQLGLTQWISEDHIFISGTHGVAKPKKVIFDIVEKKLNLNPTETVYIGDSYEKDIIGAKQAGWKAIWVNYRNKEIPEDSKIRPDQELHHPSQLLTYFASTS
ncbi:2-haloalkanoic acid dehalogenase [Gracilibacillus boraciitolerans JCM 21714]|uniref:2-haloalkanoic acid dehalogenase n=1 Tax=Gracilibacillus boraciitolerans JCM 21714 TaxID=1298598 RepID=W4VD56_9BACI|nr:HAD family hydrolase [Gracilibacillus boraciitolerans]GAE91111.1 2-haloalkanoic acid dehalogenase [Gracilibacillus boraciitolerans JCM 21714]